MNSNSNAPFGREDFFIKACFGSEGPQGPAGAAGQGATVSVGKVETVQAGQSAQVLNSGTAKDAVLDFKIPKGQDGESVSLRSPHYDSYEDLAAQHPAGTAGEAYLVGEVNFIYVWDANTNSWVSVGKLGYLPQIFTDFREDVLEELSERYTKNETDGLISAHNLSPEAHADIRQALEALQLLKLVDVLPAQGESKYIYAVPQDERTTDGQLIVVLFIWTGTEWAAVGALTTSVDLSEYLKKTEAQNTYLPKTGGFITGTLAIAREKGLIDTMMPESGSGSGYTRLRVYSYDGSWVGYVFHNTIGDASILLVDNGHLNIDVSNNKEVRIRGERILTVGDKGVSGGVASLGTDGKVPQEQLPNISAATPVTGLGQVTSASFEVNKNYAASVSGTAAFTLPTPTDTTIANKITLSLNVLANSVINWGANANAALAEFTPGKYQIRLLWNNTSSAWSAEVLKETEASSPVKLLIRFNGAISDESASPLTLAPSRTVTAFPVYAEGQYGQQKLTCTGDSADNYVTASGNNLPKLNLGTGDFTIRCWLTLASGYSYPVRIFYKDDNNQISVGNDRIHVRFGGALVLNQAISGVAAGDTAYITLTRQNGTLYFFVNGSLVHSQASAEEWDLSGFTQIFKGSGVAGVGHYGIQELIVKNTCDYVADFTAPSTPFILADSGVSDLHDADLSSLAIKAVTPNYSAGQTVENVTSGSWTNVAKTSMVICYATDSYMENYEVKVSPDNGTTAYVVGKRYDDANEKTQGTSFSFIVPAGWSFTSTNEGTYSAYIYPLGV